VRLWKPEFRGRYAESPRASAELLGSMHGVGSPLVPGYLVMTPDGGAITGAVELDIGYAEDPEGGRWLSLTRQFYREPASHLLAIAVAVAAAELTGSPIIDEHADLTGHRLADPEAIVTRLHNPDAHGPFAEAATATLRAAGIA
jgi:hypothetical protein